MPPIRLMERFLKISSFVLKSWNFGGKIGKSENPDKTGKIILKIQMTFLSKYKRF